MKHLNIYSALLMVSFLMQSCLKADFGEMVTPDLNLSNEEFPAGFNWSDQRNISIEIVGNPYDLIFVKWYLPDEQADFKEFAQTSVLKEIQSTEIITLSKSYDSLYYRLSFPFSQELQAIPIEDHVVINLSQNKPEKSQSSGRMAMVINGDFLTLGSWNSIGVPGYLVEKDVLDQELLNDIGASLPESRPVPSFNPEYLNNSNLDSKTEAPADVWITFVTEGAGWKNSLGFYTYELFDPPASPQDIDNHTIIFPNASLKNSGGGLQPGDKVLLGRFPANTGIGWFLVPNGWNGSEAVKTNDFKYSNQAFNYFTNDPFRQHFILLKDPNREIVLM
jgi:hypothetical protein